MQFSMAREKEASLQQTAKTTVVQEEEFLIHSPKLSEDKLIPLIKLFISGKSASNAQLAMKKIFKISHMSTTREMTPVVSFDH